MKGRNNDYSQTGSLQDSMKTIMRCSAESKQIKLLETKLTSLRKNVENFNDHGLVQQHRKCITKLEENYDGLLLAGNTDDEDNYRC